MPSWRGQVELYFLHYRRVRIAYIVFLVVAILYFWLGSVRREISVFKCERLEQLMRAN